MVDSHAEFGELIDVSGSISDILTTVKKYGLDPESPSELHQLISGRPQSEERTLRTIMAQADGEAKNYEPSCAYEQNTTTMLQLIREASFTGKGIQRLEHNCVILNSERGEALFTKEGIDYFFQTSHQMNLPAQTIFDRTIYLLTEAAVRPDMNAYYRKTDDGGRSHTAPFSDRIQHIGVIAEKLGADASKIQEIVFEKALEAYQKYDYDFFPGDRFESYAQLVQASEQLQIPQDTRDRVLKAEAERQQRSIGTNIDSHVNGYRSEQDFLNRLARIEKIMERLPKGEDGSPQEQRRQQYQSYFDTIAQPLREKIAEYEESRRQAAQAKRERIAHNGQLYQEKGLVFTKVQDIKPEGLPQPFALTELNSALTRSGMDPGQIEIVPLTAQTFAEVERGFLGHRSQYTHLGQQDTYMGYRPPEGYDMYFLDTSFFAANRTKRWCKVTSAGLEPPRSGERRIFVDGEGLGGGGVLDEKDLKNEIRFVLVKKPVEAIAE